MTDPAANWSFLSNYAHVLVCVADDPELRLRDMAGRVGITERTALRLVTDLEEANIITRVKEGRRNRYLINSKAHLRHPIESHCTVGELLRTILSDKSTPPNLNSHRRQSGRKGNRT
jgi:DNA-binding IclR family transcriptional regulator